MNLSYTEEQIMLREQIQKFCETEYDFYKREEVVKSDNDFDENAWKLFAEQGWLSMSFSEESGGFGFGPIELSILFEEFGKTLVIEPYLANVVLAGSVLDKSNFSRKVELIEGISSGFMHVSLAYAEVAKSYEYLTPSTNLSNENKLNGTKSLVLNAGNANQFIVLAKHEGLSALIMIDAEVDGLSIQSFKTIDGQTCGELTFENVSIDTDSIIASGVDAEALFNKMMDLSILCISAEAVGAMNASYMKTVQYTKEREQFSQPISNFQVLQHRMVDMFIETELTKSLLIKATLQLDSNDPNAENTISALKVQVGKAGRLIGQNAVQLHGGMGVSNEMSIGHYLKRFTAIDSMFGNTQYHINKYQTNQ